MQWCHFMLGCDKIPIRFMTEEMHGHLIVTVFKHLSLQPSACRSLCIDKVADTNTNTTITITIAITITITIAFIIVGSFVRGYQRLVCCTRPSAVWILKFNENLITADYIEIVDGQ